MPDSKGRPTPAEVLAALKDPAVSNWLKTFLLNQASSMSIGRYPGNGSAQDDQYVYPDAADSNFAFNFDYVIPSNFQRLISAKLSFRIRAYRTYSALTLTNTGDASVNHSHASAAHAHQMWTDLFAADTGATTLNEYNDGSGRTIDLPTGNLIRAARYDSFSTTPGGTGGQTVTHTHSISGTSVLGIAEDVAPVNPGITVAVDGTDVTAALGGPFNSQQVEIDVTQVLKTGVKLWHVLSLQPNQRVRITGILRISYYNDSRLAQ